MSVFSCILRRNSILSLLFVLLFSVANAQEEPMPEFDEHQTEDQKEFNASEVIIHHVLDDHIWHLFDGHYGTIYLPVIVYSSEKGLDVFSSHNFYDEHHNTVAYNGYELHHNHIVLAGTEKAVLDLSITKNVAMLLINA